MSTNSIADLLGIQYPIIQAPMVGVSTPALAAAVSESGALGSIGIGASSLEQAAELIAKTKTLTAKPFNVNLFCHKAAKADAERESKWLEHLKPFFAEFGALPPARICATYLSFLETPEILELIVSEKPAVISFHFGLPPIAWIHKLKSSGATLIATVTDLAEAELCEAAEIDAIIAQGSEAGGHRGVFEPHNDLRMGLFALVRLLVQDCKLPVIAAGGIMDGAGIAAALRLGAAGVQMGTAFIACPESSANEAHKQALLSEKSRFTQITEVISGRAARGIVNRMYIDVDRQDAPALPDYPIAYEAAKALNRIATAQGNHDFGVFWAGQAAPLARSMSAADLIKTLVQEWQLSE